jgi:hypothetical protein
MKEEIQKLLTHCIEYATELLTETGEAYPFGGFIDTIGNVHPLEMEIDQKNIPQISKVIETLSTYGDEEMAEARMQGYAVTYEAEVSLSEENIQNCIAIDIKHQEDVQPIFYLPFTWKDNKMEVGEVFAVKR